LSATPAATPATSSVLAGGCRDARRRRRIESSDPEREDGARGP
jgi:hypothetical protein